jgi:hypothetical protein
MTKKERNDIKYILLKERIKILSKELDKEIKNIDPHINLFNNIN